MAKHKPSVALFEVIHAAKAKQQQHQKSPAALLRTPNWWFKGKNDHLAEQAAETFAAGESSPHKENPHDNAPRTEAPRDVSPPEQAGRDAATPRDGQNAAPIEPQRDVFAFDAAQTHAEPHADVPAVQPSSRKLRTPFDAPAHEEQKVEDVNPFALFKKSKFTPPAAPVTAVPIATPTATTPAAMSASAARPAAVPVATTTHDAFDGLVFTDPEPAGPARNGRAVKVDRDNQHVTLNLSYTAAIIAGAAVLVIVSLAFILGRDSRQPTLAAHNSDRVQLSTPRPDVLTNLRPGSADRAAPVNNAPKVDSTPPPAASGRVPGMFYLAIQSYETRALAEEAAAVLKKNGIETTIDRGIPGLDPKMYSVVATQGFPKTMNNVDYQSFRARVAAIGRKAVLPQGKTFEKPHTFPE